MALEKWVPKGSLCDGEIHVKAHEFAARKNDAWKYWHHRELLKLANNPILSEESRKALWKAVHDFENEQWWRNLYIKNINMEPVLHEDKSKTTDVNFDYGRYFCEKCGTEVVEAFLYCPGCGKEINWSWGVKLDGR